MAKSRLKTVYSKLAPTDLAKLEVIANAKGITTSEFIRKAVLWALDNEEKLDADARETKLEERMTKMENHIASLGARTAIDVGTILFLIAANLEPETKDEDLILANKHAVSRLKKKLQGQALVIKDLAKGAEAKE